MAKDWGWEARPCRTCTRTKHPQTCENRNCPDWVAWFLRSWRKLQEIIQEAV